ncbi:MAG: hypothetical protein ACMUIP_13060 [bacterium]
MRLGQEEIKTASIRNTSGKPLMISSIDSGKRELVRVDFLNKEKRMPVRLMPNEQIRILVALRYKEDKPRLREKISITYNVLESGESDKQSIAEIFVTGIKHRELQPAEKQLKSSPSLPEKIKKDEDQTSSSPKNNN